MSKHYTDLIAKHTVEVLTEDAINKVDTVFQLQEMLRKNENELKFFRKIIFSDADLTNKEYNTCLKYWEITKANNTLLRKKIKELKLGSRNYCTEVKGQIQYLDVHDSALINFGRGRNKGQYLHGVCL